MVQEETKDNVYREHQVSLMMEEMVIETTEDQKSKGQMERTGITKEMIPRTIKRADKTTIIEKRGGTNRKVRPRAIYVKQKQ